MKENQSVRMEELSTKIDFPLFPLRIGWRIEWIWSGEGRRHGDQVGWEGWEEETEEKKEVIVY